MTLFLKSIHFFLLCIIFSNVGFAQETTYPCVETSMNEAPSSSGSLTASTVTRYTLKYYAHKGAPQTTTGTATSREAAVNQLKRLSKSYNAPSCMTLGGQIIGSYPE